MYNYLKYYNVPVTIVATKYDKINKNSRAKQDKIILDSLEIAQGDNIVFFSALSKKGRDELYVIISQYLESV